MNPQRIKISDEIVSAVHSSVVPPRADVHMTEQDKNWY